MEINQKMLDSLLSLSDEDLQNKLRLIASSIGFDERIAAAQTAKVRGKPCLTLPRWASC